MEQLKLKKCKYCGEEYMLRHICRNGISKMEGEMKDKRKDKYDSFKIIALMLFVVCVIAFVGGRVSASSISDNKQYDCVTLHQVCSNCSYVNLTSITYPNGVVVGINQNMTKDIFDYTYTFCNTTQLGNYIYNTCGDKDGSPTCENIPLLISTTGNGSTTKLLIFLFVGAFLFLILSMFGNTEFFLWCSGVLFIVTGIFTMIFGIGTIADLYTRTIAIISIGVGLLISIGAYLDNEQLKDEGEYSEEE